MLDAPDAERRARRLPSAAEQSCRWTCQTHSPSRRRWAVSLRGSGRSRRDHYVPQARRTRSAWPGIQIARPLALAVAVCAPTASPRTLTPVLFACTGLAIRPFAPDLAASVFIFCTICSSDVQTEL